MPKYLLDTDTCIYWLNGDRQIEKKILAEGLANVFITVITECELYYGAYKSRRAEKNIEVLRALREKVKTIHTSKEIAPLYGQVKADLERIGQVLDDADLLVASIALATKGVLVTNNPSHFSRVPDLQIDNWR